MRKFRNIPALVTLLAGFVSSVVMIIQKYSLVHFLWVLVAVMAGFYIAGLLLRVILNKAFKDLETEEEKPSEDESTAGEGEDMPKQTEEEQQEDEAEPVEEEQPEEEVKPVEEEQPEEEVKPVEEEQAVEEVEPASKIVILGRIYK